MSIPPSPATITKELWDHVNRLIVGVTEYTGLTMEMRQVLKRIETLKNADPGQAFFLQAGVYQLTGDVDSMFEALRKARALVGPVEYAIHSIPPLLNTGFYTLAQNEARVASNPINGHFSAEINHAYVAGLFSTLSTYLDAADKLKLSIDECVRDKITQANAIAQHYELSEETIAGVLNEVGEVLRANRLIYFGEPSLTLWGFDKFEDVEPHISFDFQINRDVASIASLRDQLATRIATSDLGRYPDGVVVRFSAIHRARELAAA